MLIPRSYKIAQSFLELSFRNMCGHGWDSFLNISNACMFILEGEISVGSYTSYSEAVSNAWVRRLS